MKTEATEVLWLKSSELRSLGVSHPLRWAEVMVPWAPPVVLQSFRSLAIGGRLQSLRARQAASPSRPVWVDIEADSLLQPSIAFLDALEAGRLGLGTENCSDHATGNSSEPGFAHGYFCKRETEVVLRRGITRGPNPHSVGLRSRSWTDAGVN